MSKQIEGGHRRQPPGPNQPGILSTGERRDGAGVSKTHQLVMTARRNISWLVWPGTHLGLKSNSERNIAQCAWCWFKTCCGEQVWQGMKSSVLFVVA